MRFEIKAVCSLDGPSRFGKDALSVFVGFLFLRHLFWNGHGQFKGLHWVLFRHALAGLRQSLVQMG